MPYDENCIDNCVADVECDVVDNCAVEVNDTAIENNSNDYIDSTKEEDKEDYNNKNYKTILIVDFNIIMYPCIKLYMDALNDKENPEVIWQLLENNRGLTDEFLKYDANTYRKLVKFIQLAKESNNAKVYNAKNYTFITDRLMLKDVLLNDSDKDIKYDIINISYDHKLFNNPSSVERMSSFNSFSNDETLGYLFTNDKINNLFWIKAPNSPGVNLEFAGSFKDKIKFNSESCTVAFKDPDKLLDNCNISEIYLVYSPYTVPYKFKHLFDLIVDLFVNT